MSRASETLPDLESRLESLSPYLPKLLWNAHQDVLQFHARLLALDITLHSTPDRHKGAFKVGQTVVHGASLPMLGKDEMVKWAKICAQHFRYLYGEVDQDFREDVCRGMIDLLQQVEHKGPIWITHGIMIMLCELYVLADNLDDSLDRSIWLDGMRKVGVGLCKWTDGAGEWNDEALDLLYYVEFTLGCKMGEQREVRALLFELLERLRRLAQTLPVPRDADLVMKIQERLDEMQKVHKVMDQAEMNEVTAALRDVGI
ncbi:hypothetical protein BU16DRAFT_541459 [Lophium mytilinum]|uniref:Uncharacterized protein n=1 Tax=Lophium mytilinum TaxID=390894 RepID=A0A6A6QKT9_9PEZI|nr:hypothetical protein BU16DRAFT_541459 [Lophium mytilinum]